MQMYKMTQNPLLTKRASFEFRGNGYKQTAENRGAANVQIGSVNVL